MDKDNYRKQVEGAPHAQGKRELLKFLDGGRMTLSEAIRAYCFDCTGFFDDGRLDCENDLCPLHPFMPYNKDRQKARKGNPNAAERLKEARARKKENASSL